MVKYLIGILIVFIVLLRLGRVIKYKRFHQFRSFFYILLATLFLTELVLNLLFKVQHGSWLFQLRVHPNKEIFESHPYLTVRNKKSIDQDFQGVRITHNTEGNRSDEYSEEDYLNKTVIVTIGGSTTYGVGVDNNETWPQKLEEMLGDDSIVVNLGVPGYSTIENIITASLYLDKYSPDVIILHTGLNDLRVSNVSDLPPDYSNFHEPHLVGSMGMCYLEDLPRVASIYYLVRLLQVNGIYPICDFHAVQVKGQIKKEVDQKALSYYRQNLNKLIHISKLYTPEILVVPQVLNSDNVNQGELSWWIPFVPGDELMNVVETYNHASRESALATNCFFLDSAMTIDWDKELFVDPSHLNGAGNQILAKLIREKLTLAKSK